MHRIINLLLGWLKWLVLAGVLIIIIASVYLHRKPAIHSQVELMPEAKLLPKEISLTTERGFPVSREHFENHWSLVFFGFTHCPDFCPMVLQKLSSLLKKPLSDKDNLQLVFITVDPERDTGEQLKNYLSFFNKKIIGLRGDNRAIASFSAFFNAPYERVITNNGKSISITAGSDMPGTENNQYYVNHSTRIFIINPTGKYVGYLDSSLTLETLYEGLASLR